MTFAKRFPHLFHLTRRTALEGIQKHGLLSASALLEPGKLIASVANRASWETHTRPDGLSFVLRWQMLNDGPLSRRLAPEIAPADWRAYINSMVFVFTTLEEARALKGSPGDRGVDQIILSFPTSNVIPAAGDIRVCRWNNGYLDRSKPPRQRNFSDYRPISEWKRGDTIREVTVIPGIPPSVTFDIISEA